MGCGLSTANYVGENKRRPRNVGEIVVFVPGFRTPKAMDLSGQLGYGLSKSLVERLSALRTRVVVMMAAQEGLLLANSRKVATRQGHGHGLFLLSGLLSMVVTTSFFLI